MKRSVSVTGIVFLFVFFISNPAISQKTKVTSGDSNGLKTVKFETTQGEIKTFLPSNVYSGDVISGTVVAEPKGKNDKQTEKNKNVLNGYVVELEGKETPVKQGKETWKLPETIKDGILNLLLKDLKGNIIGKTSIPISSGLRPLTKTDGLSQADFDIPSYFRAGEPEIIPGYFDGDFTNSGVSLNNVPAEILAESPEAVFFKPAENISLGKVSVALTERGFSMTEPAHVLDMKLSADKLTLTKGDQTQVHISVSGLEGIDTDVPLEITNLTPQNISAAGGPSQVILIKPGDIPANGSFTYDLNVTAVGTGGFSVMATIKPPVTGKITLLSPQNADIVSSENIAFEWGSSVPAGSYTLTIWKLDQGIAGTREEGIFSAQRLAENRPYFKKEGIIGTTFTPGSEFQPEAGPEYCWQVTTQARGVLINSMPGTFFLFPDTILMAPIIGPTHNVPGVTTNPKKELEFKDENAVRKWINLNGAKGKLKKLQDKLKSQEEYYDRIKSDPNYKEIAKESAERIVKLKATIKTVEGYIKKADEASKACDLGETRKNSQYAKEAAETEVDTGSGNLGFPMPKEGGQTVSGHRGEGKIDPKYKEKFELVSGAIKNIEELEKRLEDMETDNLYGDKKIKEYEERLGKLKEQLAEAEKNLAEIENQESYSKESEVIKEVARETVGDLKKKVGEFEDGLKKLKENPADKKAQEEAKKKLQKDVDEAYKQLRRMYDFAFKCNTEKVKECGGIIQGLVDKNSTEVSGESNSVSGLEGTAKGAEDAAGLAGKATGNKTQGMKDADKKYFEGLYDSLYANYLSLKDQAPHPVDNFLGFKGNDFKQVTSFTCKIGEKDCTVNVNLKWSFGTTPKPQSQKPANQGGDDGYYEHHYDGFKCICPININITAKVYLYWVGPYSETAANKALLYHELLHGQKMVEWLQDATNHSKICDALKKICDDGASGTTVPTSATAAEEHQDIEKWQKEFQDKIQEEEDKKAEKEKEEFKKKYKDSLKEK